MARKEVIAARPHHNTGQALDMVIVIGPYHLKKGLCHIGRIKYKNDKKQYSKSHEDRLPFWKLPKNQNQKTQKAESIYH
ncbi:hypothetical protein [Sinomicrobium oceani]|uniref:hypothetical protein n=1 Tax=Sinomicrobium oceani TaxID=1150368 RepID=UPI00227D0CD2|nr:hypothetical protein [Sinomicrobium oceani]